MFVAAQLDDAGLSDAAFRVLGRINRRWTPERGCYESKAKMVDTIPMSKDRLYAALDELDRRRFIERTGRGAGARIDPLPPSEWLTEEEAERLENVRETRTHRMSGNPGQTPGECLDNPDKLCPGNPDLRMSGNPGHKGDPPKGIHEGPSSTTTTQPGPDGGAVDPGAEGVVVDDQDQGAVVGGTEHADEKNAAWRMLQSRGVAQAVPLAADHWRHVPAAVEVYDRGLADGSIGGPGWFTGALPSWRTPTVAPAKQAATHTGRTPEQERGTAKTMGLLRDPTPPASADVVAASMAEAEAAIAEGARLRAEADEARRAERSRKRRARSAAGLPTPDDDVPQPQSS